MATVKAAVTVFRSGGLERRSRWQRAAIAVAVVAESNHHLTAVLDTVERFVRSAPDVEVLDTTAAYLEPEDN